MNSGGDIASYKYVANSLHGFEFGKASKKNALPLQMRADCHLIALDRNPGRQGNFLRRFWASRLHSSRLWRLSGIDARDRWADIGPLVDGRAEATMDGKMRRYDTELPSRGGAGCYLSHLLVHKRLLESGDDAAFVFEDDASIPHKSVDARVLVGVPSDWDVVLLGCHGVQGSGLAGEFRRIRRFVGLHAYAISASGAHKVLSAPVFPLVMQIDAYLSWMALRGKLKIYATRYNVVNQRVTKSDIQSLHVTQNSIWLGRYGFEHEPEEGGSEGLLSKNRATLEALKPNWTEIRPFKDAMGSVELRASSWTWTPWGR